MRERRPRPLDPFPYLIRPDAVRRNEPGRPRPLVVSAQHRRVLAHLANGARLLLDIDHRRALLYTFRQGLRHLAELTIRTVGRLVRMGLLVVTGREGRRVHYALALPAPVPV